MKTIGKFKITDTFRNKDQNGILVGNLVEGSITADSYICLSTQTGEATFKILGIEKIMTISGLPYTALLFELNDKFKFSELKSLRDMEIEIKE